MKTALGWLTLSIGLFFLGSTFLYAFFDFSWWVPTQGNSNRMGGITLFHVLGFISGVLGAGIFWEESCRQEKP